MINKDRLLKCSECKKFARLEEWDSNTLGQCTRRNMRRLYTPLTNEKAYRKSIDAFYLCPVCKQWVKGYTLVDENGLKLVSEAGSSVNKTKSKHKKKKK